MLQFDINRKKSRWVVNFTWWYCRTVAFYSRPPESDIYLLQIMLLFRRWQEEIFFFHSDNSPFVPVPPPITHAFQCKEQIGRPKKRLRMIHLLLDGEVPAELKSCVKKMFSLLKCRHRGYDNVFWKKACS